MAYKLDRLASSKIHPVFHVSCLKKMLGLKCIVQAKLPELDEEGSIWIQFEAIKDTREHRMRHHIVKKVLSQWKGTPPEDATWEPSSILQQFPHL